MPALHLISVLCLASSLLLLLEKKSKEHFYNTAGYKLYIGTEKVKNSYKREKEDLFLLAALEPGQG